MSSEYGCLLRPSDGREIVRYWTLSREDFDIIFRKRSDHSRLGFALLLCYLRYPGWVLGPDEVPPVALVSFVAQLGVFGRTTTPPGKRIERTPIEPA
jgi:TnpA family transposase